MAMTRPFRVLCAKGVTGMNLCLCSAFQDITQVFTNASQMRRRAILSPRQPNELRTPG